MKKAFSILIVFALMMTVVSCGKKKAEVIDLNKVLDIMTATLDELKETPVEGVDINPASIQPIYNEDQKAEYTDIFVQAFAKKLNEANLMSTTIGVGMLNDGSVEGFVDANNNGSKDYSEKQLFTVEIDSERNRLIATDTQHQYRRDSHYRPSGLFMGYFLGSMLGRQMGAGITSSRYSNMRMNRPDYHKSAVNKATRSARARSSSGSFRSGK